ncbi:MAG: XkdX family protein [Oscillospiraceae bacterium]|nr:XkdX family protein [Oscillospiraceae bacterium]
MNFETIKKNFDRGLWSKVMVKIAVKKGVITREQYAAITGEAYC